MAALGQLQNSQRGAEFPLLVISHPQWVCCQCLYVVYLCTLVWGLSFSFETLGNPVIEKNKKSVRGRVWLKW